MTEGKADSVMCAYNAINGQPACANEFLLQDQLRGKWGFQGYVVSDCGAVIDIFEGHNYNADAAEASALALRRGMDNECADFFAKVHRRSRLQALSRRGEGGLSEGERPSTRRVTRLFTARMKLGMFDPPEMVPYTKIDETSWTARRIASMARKLANESMVLLKNDGTLPLKTSGIKIAVVGPLADQTKVAAGQLQRHSDAHGFDS